MENQELSAKNQQIIGAIQIIEELCQEEFIKEENKQEKEEKNE